LAFARETEPRSAETVIARHASGKKCTVSGPKTTFRRPIFLKIVKIAAFHKYRKFRKYRKSHKYLKDRRSRRRRSVVLLMHGRRRNARRVV
jgi:hypothetical protein